MTDESWQKFFQAMIFMAGLFATIGATGVWYYTKKLNSKSSSEIRRLLQENNDMVSGGNSFGYVSAMVWRAEGIEDIGMLTFHQVGLEPLYNLKIYVFHNRDELNLFRDKEPDFYIQETSANLYKQLGTIPFKWRQDNKLIIRLVARGKEWIEEYSSIYLYPPIGLPPGIGEGYQNHYKIYKGSSLNGKLIYEFPSYLLNKDIQK